MKYLLTLSALALTVPAIGLAQAADEHRQDRERQQSGQTGPAQHTQQRQDRQDQKDQRSQTAQQRQQQGQQGQQYRQEQMGRHTSENRLMKLGSDHIKIDDLTDTTVVNRQDEELGSVSDIILDQQGRVAAVVVDSGGLMGIGSKTRALSWDDVQVRAKQGEDDEYEIVVNMSEEEFENLPEFDSERRATSTTRR